MFVQVKQIDKAEEEARGAKAASLLFTKYAECGVMEIAIAGVELGSELGDGFGGRDWHSVAGWYPSIHIFLSKRVFF